MFGRCYAIDKKKVFSQITMIGLMGFLYLSHSPILDTFLTFIIPFKSVFDFSCFLSLMLMIWSFLVWLCVLEFFVFVFKATTKRISFKKENKFKGFATKKAIKFEEIYITQSKFLC